MSAADMHWTTVWSSAPCVSRIAPAGYARDITLRYAVRTLIDGTRLRLRFSNFGSKEAAALTRVTLAPCDADGRLKAAPVLIRFGGKPACFMAAGGSALSDPVDLPVSRGEDLAVSLYLGEMTPLQSGTEISGPLSRMWFCEGDACNAAQLPPVHSMAADTCRFLETVELWSPAAAHALICFGDSITAQSWPDALALRLLREGRKNLTVARRGIGGSRILHAYENLQHRCYGPAGTERFEREIDLAGADRVVVLHGINDLIHPNGTPFRPLRDLPTAGQLVEGLRFYIDRAHSHGLRICLGTCPGIKGWPTYSPGREELRHALNAWIRSQREADCIADFDAALRDPADPDGRNPRYDSGDHLHPNLAGAERMAECVPEAFLK